MIGVGVLGAGFWGPNVVRALLSLPDCRPVRVCDPRPGRLQYVRERFPEAELTTHYDELLADKRLDAIFVVTPIHTHHELALRALDSGRHVFVEKPLAASAAQAQALVDRADRLNRVLGVGHLFVYHPAIVRLREEIQAGALGRLSTLSSERINLGPPEATVDVVWDLAVHDVAIALDLTGRSPVEVTAFGGRYARPNLIDAAVLVVRYADGLLAQHAVSWLSPDKVRRFFAAGTAGSARFDMAGGAQPLRLFGAGVDTRRAGGGGQAVELAYGPGEVRAPELPAVEPLTAECRHFLDCITAGSRPRADGAAGLAVVRVLEAAERSIAEGSRPVVLGARD